MAVKYYINDEIEQKAAVTDADLQAIVETPGTDNVEVAKTVYLNSTYSTAPLDNEIPNSRFGWLR